MVLDKIGFLTTSGYNSNNKILYCILVFIHFSLDLYSIYRLLAVLFYCVSSSKAGACVLFSVLDCNLLLDFLLHHFFCCLSSYLLVKLQTNVCTWNRSVALLPLETFFFWLSISMYFMSRVTFL
jgi:hypothetical protein